MPRNARPQANLPSTAASSGLQQYVKLENRLVLLAWINSLLSCKRNKDLLADTKGAAEGFDASGQSFLYHHLIGRGSQVKIPAEVLERYDKNICAHLAAINRCRTEPITLLYCCRSQWFGKDNLCPAVSSLLCGLH